MRKEKPHRIRARLPDPVEQRRLHRLSHHAENDLRSRLAVGGILPTAFIPMKRDRRAENPCSGTLIHKYRSVGLLK